MDPEVMFLHENYMQFKKALRIYSDDLWLLTLPEGVQ